MYYAWKSLYHFSGKVDTKKGMLCVHVSANDTIRDVGRSVMPQMQLRRLVRRVFFPLPSKETLHKRCHNIGRLIVTFLILTNFFLPFYYNKNKLL